MSKEKGEVRATQEAETVDRIDGYFCELKKLVDEVHKTRNAARKLELEQYLWTDDLEENGLVLLNELYEREARGRLNNIAHRRKCEKWIRETIINTKIKNRKMMHVRYAGEEYRTDAKYHLVTYTESGGFTEIRAIRLLEKIFTCAEFTGKNKIDIAYFGNLVDTEELVSFCEKGGKEVRLHKYVLQKGTENIYIKKGTKEYLNLKNLVGLSHFVTMYDIILFLDDASLYKQFQSKKGFREQDRKYFIDLYHEHGKTSTDLLDKYVYYSRMYEEVLRYLADNEEVMSGEYEFNASLLSNLKLVVDSVEGQCADIYCYISVGSKIGDIDIDRLNICKDEYYDGKSLTVYKISGRQKRQKSKSVNIQQMSVPLWKLVKSIGNDFYRKINSEVEYWRSWELYIDFAGVESKEDGNFFRIPYWLEYVGGDDKMAQSVDVPQLVNTIFSMAFDDAEELPCVAGYLRNVIASLIMCNANSLEGIFLSYLIKRGRMAEFIYKQEGHEYGDAGKEYIGLELKYTDRKTIYTIIEGLNSLFIRDMDRKAQVLRYDFKYKYAPDLDDDVFLQYLDEINDISKKYGLTSSRMYLYTTKEE